MLVVDDANGPSVTPWRSRSGPLGPPPAGGALLRPMSASALDDVLVLHEEEVVTEKRVVPKERVRLEKDTVTDEQQVSDEVRKERIDVDTGRD